MAVPRDSYPVHVFGPYRPDPTTPAHPLKRIESVSLIKAGNEVGGPTPNEELDGSTRFPTKLRATGVRKPIQNAHYPQLQSGGLLPANRPVLLEGVGSPRMNSSIGARIASSTSSIRTPSWSRW